MPPSTQELLKRVFGTRYAPTQRVSESLDYEPVQNAVFYKRMKAAKEKRHLFGYDGGGGAGGGRLYVACEGSKSAIAASLAAHGALIAAVFFA
jgi:hypothetical protein